MSIREELEKLRNDINRWWEESADDPALRKAYWLCKRRVYQLIQQLPSDEEQRLKDQILEASIWLGKADEIKRLDVVNTLDMLGRQLATLREGENDDPNGPRL